jgi:hypothetical protein
MVPLVDLWLSALGPNRGLVLREVDSLLGCGAARIAQRLGEGPLRIATGERPQMDALKRRFAELGATVTLRPHAPPPEWLAATDPQKMIDVLGTLRPGPSERKWRLCAVAFCRRLHVDWLHARALEIAELVADGRASRDEQAEAIRFWAGSAPNAVRQAVGWEPGIDWAEEIVCAGASSQTEERGVLVELLRDVFGNPFRPARFSPVWRTAAAVRLANQMYEARDFSGMPALAEALRDAGCDSASVLDHCRWPGDHVRGCWVVDLVLGKE